MRTGSHAVAAVKVPSWPTLLDRFHPTFEESRGMSTEREPIRRLLLRKVGQALCRHAYRLICHRGRMFLKCDFCDRETDGFILAEPRAVTVREPQQ